MQTTAVARNSLDVAGDKAVADGRDAKKVAGAAKEFEALLLGTWLSSAEDSFAKLPGADDEEDADPGKDQFQSMAMQSLATSITEAGGIGIAKMIRQQLEGQTKEAGSVSDDLPKVEIGRVAGGVAAAEMAKIRKR